MLTFKKLPDTTQYFESLGHRFLTKGKWMTTDCKFHGGSDSLRVHAETGAWRCMNIGCGLFGGSIVSYHSKFHKISKSDACIALGISDRGSSNKTPQIPKPLPIHRAIELMAFEAQLVWNELTRLKEGKNLEQNDLERLRVAAARLISTSEIYK